MKRKARILTTHLRFIEDGAMLPDDSVNPIDSNSVIEPDDTAVPYFGMTESVAFKRDAERREVWGASDGESDVVLQDIIETKKGLTITAKALEISSYTIGLAMGAGLLAEDATTYTPVKGKTKKGWLIANQLDQDGNTVNSAVLWVFPSVESDLTTNDDTVKTDVVFRVIANPNNTGTLDSTAA